MNEIETAVHDARVAAGAALLDERAPAGWRERCAGYLEVADFRRCPLALALDVHFFQALRLVGQGEEGEDDEDAHDYAVAHGFDVDPDSDGVHFYAPLQRAWERHLASTTAQNATPQ